MACSRPRSSRSAPTLAPSGSATASSLTPVASRTGPNRRTRTCIPGNLAAPGVATPAWSCPPPGAWPRAPGPRSSPPCGGCRSAARRLRPRAGPPGCCRPGCPVLCTTRRSLASTSPTTVPLITTVLERMVASTSPDSPTIRVFSLEISPLKWPSMRTVSLNESLPSKVEPWSMKAVSPPPSELRAGAGGGGGGATDSGVKSSAVRPRPKAMVPSCQE